MAVLNIIPKKVLYVDFQRGFRDHISEILREHGFNVKIASNKKQAVSLLKKREFHFFIFNYYIESCDPGSPDYRDLVEEIVNNKPEEYHNSYYVLTPEDITPDNLKTLKSLVRDRFCHKLDKDLFPKIKSAFNNYTPQNWEIEIKANYPDEIEWYTSNCDEPVSPDARSLFYATEEICRRLYNESRYNSQTLIVKLLKHQSSNKKLIQASLKLSDAAPRWYVIKIGHIERIKEEYLRINESVIDTLLPMQSSFLSRPALSEELKIGGLQFALVDESFQMKELYLNTPFDEFEDVIKKLDDAFQLLEQAWYQHTHSDGNDIGAEVVIGRIKESLPNGKSFEDLFMECFGDALALVDIPQEDLLTYDTSAIRLVMINPLKYVTDICVPDDDQPLYISTVHGDLHTGNLLLNKSGTIIPIDFAYTRKRQPLYSDFAKMEEHVIEDLLLNQIELENFNSFMEYFKYLMNQTQFDAAPYTFSTDHELYNKAWHFVRNTRSWLYRILFDKASKCWDQHGQHFWRTYRYAVLGEYLRKWIWMPREDEGTRIKNLICCSLIIESCVPGIRGKTCLMKK